MSLQIYYFSGTGNSLAVARELRNNIKEEVSVIPIVEFRNNERIEVNADAIGFVFPVYFANMPEIIKSFIEKLTFKTDPYIFAIATCNGVPGVSLFNVNKYLIKKGKKLSSGFSIDMPGNALVTPKEIEVERLREYKVKASQIANCISNREIVKVEEKHYLLDAFKSFIYKSFGKEFYITPKNVSTTSDCVGCGICTKVCPVNNIKIVNGRPKWEKECTSCLACFHWCPRNAVKGGRMLKRDQYHHPEISTKDMYLKNKM